MTGPRDQCVAAGVAGVWNLIERSLEDCSRNAGMQRALRDSYYTLGFDR
jgi:hypothetical protein